jgi:uncharacterized protein (TIGR02145 family)
MARNYWRFFSILVALLAVFFLFFILIRLNEKKDIDSEHIDIADIDGNVYTSVTIGKQVWLKENLRTTRFNDSTSILNVKENILWAEMKSSAYCWYDNDSNGNKSKYGALYNWFAVKSGKLCPIGWHVPSDNEWATLIDFLGGDSIAGGKIKEAGTSLRKNKKRTTNESGFKAILSGFRYIDGIFYDEGKTATWWTTTEISDINALSRLVSYGGEYIYRIDYYSKNHGFSVRCVRDSANMP